MGFWLCVEHPGIILHEPRDFTTEVLGDEIDEYAREHLDEYIADRYGNPNAYAALMDTVDWIPERLDQYNDYCVELREEVEEEIYWKKGTDFELYGLHFRWRGAEPSKCLKPVRIGKGYVPLLKR